MLIIDVKHLNAAFKGAGRKISRGKEPTEKDRKIALLSLFQGRSMEKRPKNSKKDRK